MNHINNFNLLGVEARQKTCIVGNGAPTAQTDGAVGDFYMDSTTGKTYKCTGAGVWIETGTQVDATLTQEGEAADAKATGDALALKADADDVDTALALKANASDVTVSLALKADKTSLANTDRRVDVLYKLTQGQAWDTDEDTTEAYSKAIPAGSHAVAVQMIGGKSDVQDGELVSADVTRLDISRPFSIGEINAFVSSHTIAENEVQFPVGKTITVPWKDLDDTNHNTDGTAYQVAWDIVRHGIVTLQDGSQVPGMFIQMHKCSAYGVQFSHQQAFFQAFSEVLPAGTYNVSFGVKYNDTFTDGTTGQFTLTQNLPVGGRLWLTGNKVEAWASATANAATESVDLTIGTEGTSLGSITSNNARSSDDLNAMYRIRSGHNRWSTSGIRQYLNAAGTGWFSSKEDFDIRPNQYAKHGFMAGFNSDFLNAIKPVKVTTALNTVEGYTETTEDTFDTFFLPSLQQMNVTPQLANVEGDAFDYWKRALGLSGYAQTYPTVYDAFKIPAINNNSAQTVRLRSAYRGNASNTWIVESSGFVTSDYAYDAYRFSPVCVIC